MPKFEILKYRPPYGELPEMFGALKGREHIYREGLFVEFTLKNGTKWIGNFLEGSGHLNEVFAHPDGKHVVVVSKGEAYIIDPETRTLIKSFDSVIESVIPVPELNMYVFVNPFKIYSLGKDGIMWTTSRISIDGIRKLNVSGTTLSGEVTDEGNNWYPFTIDLANGKYFGGFRSSILKE